MKPLNDDDFYYINKELIENNRIFFLAKKEELKFKQDKLSDINKFTDTEPAFRSNLNLLKNLVFHLSVRIS